MQVHRSQNACENQQELCILMRRLTGIQHINAVVRGDRPVVVLAGPIHARKRLLVKQALQTMLTCHSL